MPSYFVNSDTLAIIPIDENRSKILEKENTFIINENSNKIIKISCSYFGSTYEGRMLGSKALIGSIYKVPIIIEESKEIIFFPTKSCRYNTSSWISLKNINNYYKTNENTIIEFDNGHKLELNLSYGTLENQILRATRLQSILQKRKML